MKHPLTSKERKGLVAVAAAALLCVAAGPIVRHLNFMSVFPAQSTGASVSDSVSMAVPPDSIVDSANEGASSTRNDKITSEKSKKSTVKSKKSTKKSTKKSKKAAKEYPVRSPLDEPCD